MLPLFALRFDFSFSFLLDARRFGSVRFSSVRFAKRFTVYGYGYGYGLPDSQLTVLRLTAETVRDLFPFAFALVRFGSRLKFTQRNININLKT